ncbi:MAG TPA: hypothetical protein VHM92_13120 [Allosphingosinicella sp.]|nr:hypothetical protein [Allosphingosinicella sp.]
MADQISLLTTIGSGTADCAAGGAGTVLGTWAVAAEAIAAQAAKRSRAGIIDPGPDLS